MTTAQAHSTSYRPEIDGLRAVAVIAVLLYHAGIPGFAGGYVGVDVFFVISGYLITGIIRSQIEHGRFSVAQFYERRARRILPALCATLAATTVASVAIMPPRSLTGYGNDLLWTALSASNFQFWKSSGYFTGAAELNPVIHTWSLAVEEQFYLVYPLALLIIYRFAGSRAWLVIGAGFVLSLTLSILAAEYVPMSGFYLLPARAWELLAGGLLTYLTPSAAVIHRWAGTANLSGLALIAAAVALFDQATPFPGWRAVVPVTGTALLIVAARSQTLAGRLLSGRVIVGIGLVSYSLYLIHQPILALLRTMNGGHFDTVSASLALAASLLLAIVSWRWIERPFRSGGNALKTRGSVFAASLLSLCLLGLAGWGLAASKGLPQRFTPTAVAAVTGKPLSPSDAACVRAFEDVGVAPCVLGDISARARFALVGDSHAWQLIPAMKAVAESRGWRIDVYAKSACPPGGLDFVYATLRRRYHECSEWAAGLPITSKSYSAVMLTASSAGYRTNAGDPITPERWRAGLARLFEGLRNRGAPVIWFLDTPHFDDLDPRLCVERSILFGKPALSSCSAPRSTALDAQTRAAETAAARANGTELVDLAPVLCDATYCRAALDGKPAMQDSNHITPETARRLSLVIEKVLARYAASDQRP